jgi:hypothetical protein
MKKASMAIAAAFILVLGMDSAGIAADPEVHCEVVSVKGEHVELKCSEKEAKQLKPGSQVKVVPQKIKRLIEGC